MKATKDKDLGAYLSSLGCLIVGCAVCLVYCFILSCRVYICLAGCVILSCGLSYMAPWQEQALAAAKTAGKKAVAELPKEWVHQSNCARILWGWQKTRPEHVHIHLSSGCLQAVFRLSSGCTQHVLMHLSSGCLQAVGDKWHLRLGQTVRQAVRRMANDKTHCVRQTVRLCKANLKHMQTASSANCIKYKLHRRYIWSMLRQDRRLCKTNLKHMQICCLIGWSMLSYRVQYVRALGWSMLSYRVEYVVL